MLKKTLMAAAIAMASVQANAAITLATDGDTGVGGAATFDTFATELFGTGSDAVTLTTATVVTLDSDAIVDAGEAAEITFTLTGGQFGAAVTLADMAAGAGAPDFTASIKSGGAIGDTSVTFTITATVAWVANDEIEFTITALTNASILATAAEEVTVAATIVPTVTAGGNAFPTTITVGADATDDVVATSAAEHTLTIGNGGDKSIDVDNRSDILAAVAIDHDDDAATADRDGLLVGTVTSALVGGAEEADNTAFSYADGGAGTYDLTVSGATINAGDVVCIDLDGDGACQTAELFTISGNTATYSATLAALTTEPVYYVANGTTTLTPSTYTLDAVANFTVATSEDDTGSADADTSYSGLTADGWALAVPGSSSADIANVRLTNETTGDVTVFAQGYAQDGTDLGFLEVITLTDSETEVLSAADLEAVFGTWTGRARFDFSTSGNVSVQTMVRSGGILNNMSPTTIQGDAR